MREVKILLSSILVAGTAFFAANGAFAAEGEVEIPPVPEAVGQAGGQDKKAETAFILEDMLAAEDSLDTAGEFAGEPVIAGDAEESKGNQDVSAADNETSAPSEMAIESGEEELPAIANADKTPAPIVKLKSVWSRLVRRSGEVAVEAPENVVAMSAAEDAGAVDVVEVSAENMSPSRKNLMQTLFGVAPGQASEYAVGGGDENTSEKITEDTPKPQIAKPVTKEQISKAQQEEIEKHIRALRLSADYREQLASRKALIGMGEAIRQAVQPLLIDGRPIARVHAILILRELGGPQSCYDIFKLLDDQDANIRYHASMALVKLSGQNVGYHYNDLTDARKISMQRWFDVLVENKLIVLDGKAEPAKTDNKKAESGKSVDDSAPWWKRYQSILIKEKVEGKEEGTKKDMKKDIPWWEQAPEELQGKSAKKTVQRMERSREVTRDFHDESTEY